MIEEDLDDLAADAHHLAQCFFERGEAYFNKGNYTMAISQYSFAIKLNPREPTYYILRAMAHQYNRQYTLAVKDYTTVIFLCPDDLKPVLLRGICFLSWTRYNSAIKDFDTYISKAPDNAHAYFYRGLTNKGLGKFKETIQDLRKAAWLGDKEAIVELNKIKDFEYEQLVKALKYDIPELVIKASIELGKLKDPRSVIPLLQASRNRDEDVRTNIINVLCDLGNPAFEILKSVAKDENSAIKELAAKAFNEILKKLSKEEPTNITFLEDIVT